jgi:hypothetical protein
MRRASGIRLSAAALLVIQSAGALARAQDDPEPEDEHPAPRRPVVVISDEQLWRYLSGSIGDADTARQHFESVLRQRLELVARSSQLTPEQQRKLEVAGRGDIKRFFDRFQEKKDMINHTQGDMRKLQAVLLELQRDRFNQAFGDLFGEGSLFAKTLRKTVFPEQRSRLGKEVYRSRVEWVISLKDRSLGLSDWQHRRLVDVIVDETLPPEKSGQYDAYAVMYQASYLPEARLRQILDDAQWRKLQEQFQEVRRFERVLIREGYLPERDPTAVARPAVAEQNTRTGDGRFGSAAPQRADGPRLRRAGPPSD